MVPIRFRPGWRLLAAGSALAALVALFWLTDRIAAARAVDGVARSARTQAILIASGFRRELDKFRLVPIVLAGDSDARTALVAPTPARIDALNRKLEALSAETGAVNVYLLDARGTTVAASNWNRPSSFLGDNYAFRAYFHDALRRGSAQQFALGQRSQQPGLYISRRLDDDTGRPIGVIVVKIDFHLLENDWRQSATAAFVTDARGIILVTATPQWRFQTIRALTPAQRSAARRSLDYGTVPLRQNALYANGGVVPVGAAHAPGTTAVEATEPVDGWRVHLLAPTGPALAGARTFARLTAGIAALTAAAAWLLWRYRRRVAAARVTAATEARLAGLRDQLVQANKLATLGQITAGVAHEINQPVAAIASYAHNARTLIARDRAAEAGDPLERIGALTERIGLITRELRGFARRSSGEIGRVSLDEVFDGLRLLLRDRLAMLGAELVVTGPSVAVRGERVGLEQVLVNLVQNALDAGARTIEAQVDAAPARVRVAIADDGPGLPPAVRDSLFQPFKTSKADGLGLGLVISHDIVAAFGGTLTAEAPPHGAVFVLDLERMP